MAEFKKVIEEYRRMCKFFVDESCDKCPLNYETFGFCDDVENMDLDEFEDIVMTWSKENPKPVYPTLNELIQHIANNYNENNIKTVPKDTSVFCKMYGDKSIPENVAKEFGILPINMCGLTKYTEESEWR